MSPETQTARHSMSFRSKWALGLAIAVMLGIGFRLIWPGDIEYKVDEYYTFMKTNKFLTGGGKPEEGLSRWLGMPTSKGFRNTGMSLWVFYAIGSVSGAGSPPALARGVQVCNVAAILLLLGFAWRCLAGREREWWLWTVALLCVNPFTVLFERKIWPPSVLPLMMVVFLAAWRSRSTRWGAFCWGLLGIIASQIHMAGFFYAAAFFLWTASYDRRRVAWRWWFAGNLLGVIPMLPWIYYMAGNQGDSGEFARSAFVGWWRPFANYFWVDWVTEPFGLGLGYFLGRDFRNFFRFPVIGSHATYGTALLLGIAILLEAGLLAPGLLRWLKNRAHWRAAWKNDHGMFTTSALQAGFWFFGILLTVSCIRFERHYLLVAFPLVLLWVPWFALPAGATGNQESTGRRLLLALCITNALITFAFMDFIHANGGAPDGSYYKTYVKQLQDKAPDDPVTWNWDWD